jgi:hypothetical protein
MRMLLIPIAALLILLMAYIRLAPSDPALWHSDPAQGVTGAGGFQTSRIYPDPATGLLTRLNTLALATPRTTLLAGDAQSGRITWVTRSLIMGFPDYTTAQATETETGTRLDIYAHLRFGGSDFGVNARRVTLWLGQL